MDNASPLGLAFAFMQNTKRNIACYVDGFNLYHALETIKEECAKAGQPLPFPSNKVNLWSLTESLIRPEETLVAVNYFSAFATWKPTSHAKHQKYVSDLEAVGVTPIMAHFKERRKFCKNCHTSWVEHEEKGTDVRIALKIIEDAEDDVFDRAYIVSADSDLVPVVESIRNRFQEKGVFILTPPKRYSIGRALRVAGHASKEITVGRINEHLFVD